MGAGAFLEPLVVVGLLFGGAWINRTTDYTFSAKKTRWDERLPEAQRIETDVDLDIEEARLSQTKRSLSPSLLPSQENKWREREIRILGYRKVIETPNTAVFRNRLLSRLLHKFPFLVEAWYWALIYWVRNGPHKRSHADLTYAGLPTRSSIHGRHPRSRYSPRCAPTCA